MRTTRQSTSRRTTLVLRALPLAAVAALAVAQPAGALPVGGGGGGGINEPVNQPPVPKFTISPNPALVSTQLQVQARTIQLGDIGVRVDDGDAVKFDAAASTDDTGIAKYEWDFDGNGTYDATGRTASHRYTAVGTFDAKLRVTDDSGAARTLVHTVRIHRRPKAVLTPTNAVVLIGQQLAVTAKDSTDDNGIAKFDFDLDGDGTYETANGQNPQAGTSFTTLGAHRVGVRVTDVYGATATASVPVTVHRAPTAAFTDAPSPARVGEQVTFDGSGSSDDAPIAKYEWDLDGDTTFETTSTTPTATKAYTTPGTRTIRLRVTDDHGVQDVVARTLRVDPAPAGTAGTGGGTGTGTAAADTTAPKVVVTPRSAKMSRKGVVTLKVRCPKTERACKGKVTLRSTGKKVGSKAFTAGGGQTATVKITLSKAARKTVGRRGKLTVTASAAAKDAAGNARTVKATVTVKR